VPSTPRGGRDPALPQLERLSGPGSGASDLRHGRTRPTWVGAPRDTIRRDLCTAPAVAPLACADGAGIGVWFGSAPLPEGPSLAAAPPRPRPRSARPVDHRRRHGRRRAALHAGARGDGTRQGLAGAGGRPARARASRPPRSCSTGCRRAADAASRSPGQTRRRRNPGWRRRGAPGPARRVLAMAAGARARGGPHAEGGHRGVRRRGSRHGRRPGGSADAVRR